MIVAQVAAWMLMLQAAPAQGTTPPTPDYSQKLDFSQWPGIGYAWQPSTPTFPTSVTAQKREPLPGAIPWRLRIVVYSRIDTLLEEQVTEKDRLYKHTIHEIGERQIASLVEEVEKLPGWVAEATGGDIRLIPTIQVEEDAYEFTTGQAREFIQKDLELRLNGGRFDADDRLDRGPFDSILAIHAIPWESATDASINGMSARVVPLPPLLGGGAPGSVTQGLGKEWWASAIRAARSQGILLPAPSTLATMFRPGGFGAELPASTLLSNLKRPGAAEPLKFAQTVQFGIASPNVKPRIETGVLVYDEQGAWRQGGLDLPKPAEPVPIGPDTHLSLELASTSEDPISIRLGFREGPSEWVSLAGLVPAQEGFTQVVLPLGQFQGRSVASLAIGPSPAQTRLNRRTAGSILYRLRSIRFTQQSAPIVPGPRASDLLERVEQVQQSTLPADWVRALDDRSDWIRLSGLRQLERTEDLSSVAAGLEAKLSELAASSYDAAVAMSATRLLGRIGTDRAMEALRGLVLRSLSDPARGEAARQLALRKEPNLQASLIPLVTARSLSTRIALAAALKGIDSEAGGMVRMTLHQQSDPALLCAVIRSANPKDSAEVAKVQWLAVNDPHDAVRMEARRLLLSSPSPSAQAEGLRALEDESIGARRLFLDRLVATDPLQSQQLAISALRQPSPTVVAAAVRAISRCPALPVELPAEVAESDHPRIQLALIEFSARRNTGISPMQRKRLQESPDPEVAEAFRRIST